MPVNRNDVGKMQRLAYHHLHMENNPILAADRRIYERMYHVGQGGQYRGAAEGSRTDDVVLTTRVALHI
jgi:hypothetical protein